jgi:hypothetical protein
MNALLYLLQLNIYLLLFYCLYVVLLRNETFSKINRLYLVGSALHALAIPLFRAEWVKYLFVTDPIVFVYKKAIRNIHEFIADEIAAASLDNKAEYAQLMVSNAVGTQTQKLVNSFFNETLLKRRLIMLNKNKSQGVAILKYGLSVPLFAIMVIFTSATIEKSTTVRAVVSGIEKGFPVVVDAITNGSTSVDALPEISGKSIIPSKLEASNTVASSIDVADSMALESVRIHFAKNIRYSPSDQQLRKIGASYLTFELDTAGIIREPSVVQSMSDSSKADLLRVAKIAKAFGQGLVGKYILAVSYELSGSSVSENLSLLDNFDFSQYPKYQKIKEITVRGYVISTALEATSDRLRKYFANNIKYPIEAYKAGVDGIVSLAFELNDAGIIINPTLVGFQ